MVSWNLSTLRFGVIQGEPGSLGMRKSHDNVGILQLSDLALQVRDFRIDIWPKDSSLAYHDWKYPPEN